MTAAPSVIPLTLAECSVFDAFHVAETMADGGKRPLTSEMIEVLDHERDRLGRSMRVAYQEYAAPFDPATMRRYVVLRYVIDLIERMAEHKSEVVPILFAEHAPRRRRV